MRQSRYLQVRLRIERDKLVDWAVLANLSEDERAMSSGLRLNKQKVNGSLQDVRLVLLELVKLSGSYEVELDRSGIDSDYGSADEGSEAASIRSNLTLQRKAMSFVKKTRAFPRRLRWASFDRVEFELLLAKLSALNENMVYFFDRRQQDNHLQMQQDSFTSILQASDKFEQLVDLMASLKATTKYKIMPAHEQRLLRLTRFKAFNIAMEGADDASDEALIKSHLGDTHRPPRPIRLDSTKLLIMGEDNLEGSPSGAWGIYEDIPVWVEWRYFLRDEQKPDGFRVPDCLGYLYEPEERRFGFAFRGEGAYLPPRLSDMISSRRQKPSLTSRLQMARAVATSIWYLHATSWTHKGLRSENIMFPFSTSAGPYLAGFDYARPANSNEEASERPATHHDLYRHPATQFNVPRDGPQGFTKIHDIYSLGVVLYEIGMWKPVDVILGMNAAQGIRVEDVRDAQTRLLSQEGLMNLAADVGDVYMAAVTSCLSGDFGFDGFDGIDDRQTNYDARLQLEFGERVIRKLESIKI
ncbi:hypothetical protein M406DRAFT_74319 [Cryphonectria parasitica EP155]|uniref:Protein kinase domain-containing protein n=1 Tax=Cryphonectria parasitica (strain ATCC 38755 / EP155) TaxID=660469 RepID=A0A9P5CJU2_CRYP1|nr:uncharacterized protein M406DRAFT_74319 [Cryphonectria parasitica EP155]KAF3761358.1 hypothetical protein M406DRAFT_74319 [Cryphonectria parasitica EP155]